MCVIDLALTWPARDKSSGIFWITGENSLFHSLEPKWDLLAIRLSCLYSEILLQFLKTNSIILFRNRNGLIVNNLKNFVRFKFVINKLGMRGQDFVKRAPRR